jgi:hypothetical protein
MTDEKIEELAADYVNMLIETKSVMPHERTWLEEICKSFYQSVISQLENENEAAAERHYERLMQSEPQAEERDRMIEAQKLK